MMQSINMGMRARIRVCVCVRACEHACETRCFFMYILQSDPEHSRLAAWKTMTELPRGGTKPVTF